MGYVRSPRRPVSTPFLTEIGGPKRESYSTQAKPTLPFISPFKTKFPQCLVQRHQPPSNLYDALDLQTEYNHLLTEIQKLRPEVQSYRQIFIRLKDELFLINRELLVSEIEYAQRAPGLNHAVGRGSFSTAIGGLSFENEDNRDEIVDLRKQLTAMIVLKLKDHVGRALAELIRLRAEITTMKDAENATRAEIETIRKQISTSRVRAQKVEIHGLIAKIRVIEKKNAELDQNAEILETEIGQIELTSEKQIQCKVIEDMIEELREKRKQFCQKCDQLIEMKSQQLVDVERAEKEREWNDSD